MATKSSDTLDPPRYKHFTVDPSRPIGADVEDDRNENTLDGVPPAAAFNEDEAEQVKALSDAAKEAHDERTENERKAREERAKSDERPKPSELLSQQQGAGTEGAKSKQSKSEK